MRGANLVESRDFRNCVLGDDPRMPKGRGKPTPDIYLLALECINKELRLKVEPIIYPEECLVLENSVPRVEAGRTHHLPRGMPSAGE